MFKNKSYNQNKNTIKIPKHIGTTLGSNTTFGSGTHNVKNVEIKPNNNNKN